MVELIGGTNHETHELSIMCDEAGRVVTVMDVPKGHSSVRISDILPDELGTSTVVAEHLPGRKPRHFEKWKMFRTHFSRTEIAVYREVRA